MGNKHTPGPWIVAELSNTDVVTNRDKMIASARQGLNGIESEEAQANARLIAAAPDLLAALEAIIGHEKHLLNQYRVADAIAAIAKAKGE